MPLATVARIDWIGEREVWDFTVPGYQNYWHKGVIHHNSKSEYAGKKCVKVEVNNDDRRGWSFADTEANSIARQQPIFQKYMPIQWRRKAQGRQFLADGNKAKLNYSRGTGFTAGSYVLPNGSQHWFKNYKQSIEDMEGDQLDVIWLDELRDVDLLKTLRLRLVDRNGLLIATFTSKDDNYGPITDEYDKGSKTLVEVDAELLPINDIDGKPTGRFEKVPRFKVAGPGSDGDQRANMVYFHITDNPFFGANAIVERGQKPIYGKERWYYRFRGASREKILARVYGILLRNKQKQFPTFNETIHGIARDKIPRAGTNYHIVDPCPGRNWFMIWIRVVAQLIKLPGGREVHPAYIYREWPSHGHAKAYIPGIGDQNGVWALTGDAADGKRGEGQTPFGWGLDRYKSEILRLENGEIIMDRLMDSRYGNSPTQYRESQTTLIDEMAKLDMIFHSASGRAIDEGTTLVNTRLDYDKTVPIGDFSPQLARINQPTLFVSEDCPNTIFAFKEWTNKDKEHGACKDPIDCVRYAELAEFNFVGPDAFVWSRGGSY